MPYRMFRPIESPKPAEPEMTPSTPPQSASEMPEAAPEPLSDVKLSPAETDESEDSSKPPTPPTVSPPSSRRASSEDPLNGKKSPRSSRIPLALAADGKPKPEPPAISRIWPPSPATNRVRPLAAAAQAPLADWGNEKDGGKAPDSSAALAKQTTPVGMDSGATEVLQREV